MSDFRQRGIAAAVFKFKFSDDEADFIEMWGAGVGMPSILAAIPRDAENLQHNRFRRFAHWFVGIRPREVAHNLVEYFLLNCRALGRCFTCSNKLVQKDSEQGRARKVERRFTVADCHDSVSVVGFSNCNEERAPTESQGPVGVCPLKPQGDSDA